MARFVVPVMVLFALIGWYAVGKQPGTLAVEETRDELGPPNRVADVPPRQVEATEQLLPRPAGRYVPAEGGRMLDTTNGTRSSNRVASELSRQES